MNYSVAGSQPRGVTHKTQSDLNRRPLFLDHASRQTHTRFLSWRPFSRILERGLPGAHSCIQMIISRGKKNFVKGASEHQNLGCAPKPGVSHTPLPRCRLLCPRPSNRLASSLNPNPFQPQRRRHLGLDPYAGQRGRAAILCFVPKGSPVLR